MPVYVLILDELDELLVNVYEVIIIPPPPQEYIHYLYLTMVNYFSMQDITGISEMCVIAPAVAIF